MVAPEVTSLRERRRRDTEAAIHRAAVELISENGYDAVTVPMISERAGISVRTFFNYFANKETAVVLPFPPFDEALSAVVRSGPGADRLMSDVVEMVINHVQSHTENSVGLATLLPMIYEVPELLRLHTAELAQLEIQLGGLLAERLRLPISDRRVDVLAGAMMATASTAIQRWCRDPGSGSMPDEVRCCMSLLEPLQSL
ncbi:TetR/AcrR family transcriptional regulator [Mycolicibacter minnesotensis]